MIMVWIDVVVNEGIDLVIEWVCCYIEVGVDVIFVEVLVFLEDFCKFICYVFKLVLVNMIEFGKIFMFVCNEFVDVGVVMILYLFFVFWVMVKVVEVVYVGICKLGL